MFEMFEKSWGFTSLSVEEEYSAVGWVRCRWVRFTVLFVPQHDVFLRHQSENCSSFDDLPRITLESEFTSNIEFVARCDMCTDDIEEAVVLECGHKVHYPCAKKWFEEERWSSCPYCRFLVIDTTLRPDLSDAMNLPYVDSQGNTFEFDSRITAEPVTILDSGDEVIPPPVRPLTPFSPLPSHSPTPPSPHSPSTIPLVTELPYNFTPTTSEMQLHMSEELPRNRLQLGPFRNRNSSSSARPENPKQKGLTCPNCEGTWTEYSKTATVANRSTTRESAQSTSHFRDEWICHSSFCAKSSNPCASCPVCSQAREFKAKKSHRCTQMISMGLEAVQLVPAFLQRQAVPCSHCGVVFNGRCCCRSVSFVFIAYYFNVVRRICNSLCNAKTFDARMTTSERDRRIQNHQRRLQKRSSEIARDVAVDRVFPHLQSESTRRAVQGVMLNNPSLLNHFPDFVLSNLGAEPTSLQEYLQTSTPTRAQSFGGFRRSHETTTATPPSSSRTRYSIQRIAERTGGLIK